MGKSRVSNHAASKTYHNKGTSEHLDEELGNLECTICDTCSQTLLGRGRILVSYA
jgi:hypothetical protein